MQAISRSHMFNCLHKGLSLLFNYDGNVNIIVKFIVRIYSFWSSYYITDWGNNIERSKI